MASTRAASGGHAAPARLDPADRDRRARRLWALGGRRRHGTRLSPASTHYFARQQELYAASGPVVLFLSRPRSTPISTAALAPALRRRHRDAPLVPAARRRQARLAALAHIGTSSSSPRSSASCWSCWRWQASWPSAGRSLLELKTLIGVLILVADPDRARLHSARLRYGARLRGRHRRRASDRRNALDASGRATGVAVVGSALVLWILPSLGRQVLKPYQTQRLTGFIHPSFDPTAATYQSPSRRSRSAPAACMDAARKLDPDQPRLFARRSHRLHPRRDRRAARLRRRLGSARALPLDHLARPAGARQLPRRLRLGPDRRHRRRASLPGLRQRGMTMGIAPITGIPLPLVSVGGSSMIANLAGWACSWVLRCVARARGVG